MVCLMVIVSFVGKEIRMRVRLLIVLLCILCCGPSIQVNAKTTLPIDGNTVVKNVKVVNKKKLKIRVVYKKVPEGRYQIQLSSRKDFKKCRTVETFEHSYEFKGLKYGKVYYVRVRPFYPTPKGAVFGKWSKCKKIKIKK